MNYDIIYNKIIENAKCRESRSDYFEKHHIIPRCLGGANDTENIVKLTAKEHYLCHYLLSKINKDNSKLFFAFKMMACVKSKGQNRFIPKFSAKQYEFIKSKNAEFRKSFKYSDDVKKLLSIKAKNQKHSDETKLKISKANFGRVLTDEWKLKISNSTLGKPAWNNNLKLGINKSHSEFMKLNNPKSKRCKIDNIEFNKISDAALYAKHKYNIGIVETRRRFKSNDYSDWILF